MKLEIEETIVEGWSSGIELVAFAPDGRSFLHLSQSEFESAELIGTVEQITQLKEEYFGTEDKWDNNAGWNT